MVKSKVGVGGNGQRYRLLVMCLVAARLLCFGSPSQSRPQMPPTPPAGGYRAVPAFGDVKFEDPVAVVAAPGETNRLFVVERTGRIMVITNLAQPTKAVFLDLRTDLYSAYLEAGLLGLAFHPGFATNGYFFVYRTVSVYGGETKGLHDQLSRFQVRADDPNRALPDSQVVILSQSDDRDTHNAGDIQFGPDGYLYLALGDEGPAPYRQGPNPQPIDRDFFGCILRLDVDKRPGSLPPNPHPAVTSHYAIPPDNPFVGVSSYQGEALVPELVRTEIYAHGFRNPWRMSFEPATGRLFVGDVGAGSVEEVDVVQPGGNYGWPYYEGLDPQPSLATAPLGFSHRLPLFTYRHGFATNQGSAIIGGLVYRGVNLSMLAGKYLFGDNVSGHIWSLTVENSVTPARQWLTTERGLGAFGLDPRNGDPLLVNVSEGVIKRLEHLDPAAAPPFPQTLEETGMFRDLTTLTPIDELVPYEVNVPFWSDNASKSRWFYLPEGPRRIGFNPYQHWSFPTGMVWVKHFELEMTNGVASSRRRLETRFLVKTETGVYGVTYRWGGVTTNATLVPAEGLDEAFVIDEGGKLRTQTWRYPGRAECSFCHTAGGGEALGFNTVQLNRGVGSGELSENQLTRWSRNGYFQVPLTHPVAELPALAAADDPNASPPYRARSYLSANCSHCHQPDGDYTVASWDARFSTPLSQTRLLGRLLQPRNLGQSVLLERVGTLGNLHMPPIASRVSDGLGLELLTNWISSFPPPPWQTQDIGDLSTEGDSSLHGQVYTLSGAGAGLGGHADAFHGLFQPSQDNFVATVRLLELSGDPRTAQAGLILRETAAPSARQGAVLRIGQTGLQFQWRSAAGAASIFLTNDLAGSSPWLRLLRQGRVLKTSYSADGETWVPGGSAELEVGPNPLLGLAVASGHSVSRALARFDQFDLLGVRLDLPKAEATYRVTDSIELDATASVSGSGVARVEFYDGTNKLGEATTSPYRLIWTNMTVGTHALMARAVSSTGAGVQTEPIPVIVELPSAQILPAAPASLTDGRWRGVVGRDGYAIANHATNLPAYAALSFSDASALTWADPATSLKALSKVPGPGRIASAWTAPARFDFELRLLDGAFHKLTLHFIDWKDRTSPVGGRRQRVEVLEGDTGQSLRTETLAEFGEGRFLTMLLRGHVRVRVTALTDGSAVLSGLFFDSRTNSAPTLQLLTLPEGDSLTLPTDLQLTAVLAESEGSINKAEFFSNGQKLGENSSPPYSFHWTNALAGEHVLMVRADDPLTGALVSEPRHLALMLPLGHAAFAFEDSVTGGNWPGAFGRSGYLIVNDATNLPAVAELRSESSLSYTWLSSTPDSRALRRAEGQDRLAATTVQEGSWAVDLRLLDGRNHQMTLYFLDWDYEGRRVQVEVLDGATGRRLDQRELRDYANGQYLAWIVRGHVRIRLSRLAGANVGFSGWFLDPLTNEPPRVRIESPLPPVAGMAPAQMLIVPEVADADGVERVDFFANEHWIGAASQPPFAFLWPRVLAGEYQLRAKAVDSRGLATDSSAVSCFFDLTNSQARFEREDAATRGAWRSRYGSEGFQIVNDAASLPIFATVEANGMRAHTWVPYPADERALLRDMFAGRIASCWVSQTNFLLEVRLADGRPHQLALYCLDWDTTQRRQTISIYDAETDALLDSRAVSDFNGGKYLVWIVRGAVRIVVTRLAGANAVVSGLFLDPASTIFEEWRQEHFLPGDLADLDISGPGADPDRDGLSNFAEYAAGLEPKSGDAAGAVRSFISEGYFYLSYPRRKGWGEARFKVLGSKDLLTWSSAEDAVAIMRVEDNGTTERVTLRTITPVPNSSQQFFRLIVEREAVP